MRAIRGIFDINYPVHVISRAVDGRKLFADEADCFRFIFQTYTANIGKPARNLQRQDIIKMAQAILFGEEISSKFVISEHPPLVNFLDFSLVVNHNHFYLVPNSENAIPIFVKALNTGFAAYSNLKYDCKGALFGSRYQSVVTKTQLQADAVSRYVSVINTLDVFQPGWRKNGLKDPKNAFHFLRTYQFSSFPDKIGERSSKILASPEILEKYLTLGHDIKTYKEFTESFLQERSDLPRKFSLE